jgi:predicted dehydrogenase
MSEGKLRVALMGVGAIAQVVHLPVLDDLDEVELAGVCDVDNVRANALAARFGIPHIFRKDEEVFRSDLIDAIIICTPSYLHEEQAIAALEAGKHVLVEKPLALSPESVERVIAVAERTGRTLMVAMNNRYRPDTVALRPFAQNGELGEVFHTYSCYGRGIDMVNGAYQFLDLVPKGRDEDGLDFSMAWLRRHDRY